MSQRVARPGRGVVVIAAQPSNVPDEYAFLSEFPIPTEADLSRLMDEAIGATSAGAGTPSVEPFAWWYKLSGKDQRAVDARTEDYIDHHDYWRREVLARADQEALAKYTELEFGELRRQAIDGVVRTIMSDQRLRKENRKDTDKARIAIQWATSTIQDHLFAMLDVKRDSRHERREEVRDRGWSKAIFEGKSPDAIALESGIRKLDPSTVRKFTDRHRRRRGYFSKDYSTAQWQLRSRIYWAEFIGHDS